MVGPLGGGSWGGDTKIRTKDALPISPNNHDVCRSKGQKHRIDLALLSNTGFHLFLLSLKGAFHQPWDFLSLSQFHLHHSLHCRPQGVYRSLLPFLHHPFH
jgi:hypothetical protein